MNDSTILIVGKHGKTGRRVESRLQAAGTPTLGVSRSTTPAFDWEAPETWPAVLEGVRAAYVTYHPDLSVPRAEGAIRDFARLARESGVEHIVLLSGRGEDGAKRAEDVLRASGIDWNVVQASWFAQNFSENFMLDGILSGELVMPICEAREPFVDVDDVADVAVAALLEPGLRNRLFEVTGPRSITFAECVDAISNATGDPVKLRQVPLDVYLATLADEGVPSAMRALLEELFTVLFDGRNAATADGVHEALGRSPTDFDAFARKTADSGVWNRAPAGRVA
jgi:uncharacterized protein YbjT (DUF2867 family)